jgi:hypothetical protein
MPKAIANLAMRHRLRCRSGTGGCHAFGINEGRADERASQSGPLLYQIDWRAMQLQFVATAKVPPQVEGATVADQCTCLIDPGTDYRHGH